MTSNELDDGNRVESTATSVREPRVPAFPRSRVPAALWRHSDFMKLWLAQTISVFGDQFTGLAIPLIAVLMLQATPGQMGLLTAVERAPFLLIGLFAGVWVDRLPRRPILVAGDLGRAAVLLTIPLAALLGGLRMPHLYAVGLLVGVLTLFFDVAYQAFLPALVGRQQLVEGNSKLEATRSLANLAGPSVAGVVIQALSAPIAIILDALSFVISGGLISRISGPPGGEVRSGADYRGRSGARWPRAHPRRLGDARHGVPVPGARGAADEFRQPGLQHQSGQPASGDHSVPFAGPHECHDAVPGVGHHAAGRSGRRYLGRGVGPATGDRCLGGRRPAGLSVGRALAGPCAQGHPRPRRIDRSSCDRRRLRHLGLVPGPGSRLSLYWNGRFTSPVE